MGLIILLILGALVGYAPSRLLHREEGILASTVIGVVGAFIGSFLAHLVNRDQPFLAFDGGSLLAAFVGALLLVAALNYVERKRVRP